MKIIYYISKNILSNILFSDLPLITVLHISEMSETYIIKNPSKSLIGNLIIFAKNAKIIENIRYYY